MIKRFAVSWLLSVACVSSAQAATYGSFAGFAAAAPGATVIENFETVAPALLEHSLASLNQPAISFTPLPGDPSGPNVYVAPAGYNNFGAGIGVTTSTVLTSNGNEQFTGTLVSPARALGFVVLFNGLGPITVQFFHGASVLDTLILGNAGENGYGFAGIVSNTTVTGFSFVATDGGVLNTGIDNIRVAAVPEPSAWLMMIAGLGVGGLLLRRRRMVGLAEVGQV